MKTTTVTRALAVATIALAAVTLSGCSILGNILGGGDGSFDLAVGDCINGATPNEDGTVEETPTVDCATPHEEEVYLVTTVDVDEFPGNDALGDQGSQLCVDAYEDFVGLAYEDSLLDFWVLYPTEETFAIGDRQIVCSISKFDDAGEIVKVTGTLKDSQE